ncbi:hypothetical protein MMC14_009512 [Varicellaria rhodocarpa]|nr:hypothetical protein [Varicellaria rhodocarpa]
MDHQRCTPVHHILNCGHFIETLPNPCNQSCSIVPFNSKISGERFTCERCEFGAHEEALLNHLTEIDRWWEALRIFENEHAHDLTPGLSNYIEDFRVAIDDYEATLPSIFTRAMWRRYLRLGYRGLRREWIIGREEALSRRLAELGRVYQDSHVLARTAESTVQAHTIVWNAMVRLEAEANHLLGPGEEQIRVCHNDPDEDEDEDSDGEDSDGEDSDGEDSDGEDSDGEDSDGEDSDGEDSDDEDSNNENSDDEDSNNEDSDDDTIELDESGRVVGGSLNPNVPLPAAFRDSRLLAYRRRLSLSSDDEEDGNHDNGPHTQATNRESNPRCHAFRTRQFANLIEAFL